MKVNLKMKMKMTIRLRMRRKKDDGNDDGNEDEVYESPRRKLLDGLPPASSTDAAKG